MRYRRRLVPRAEGYPEGEDEALLDLQRNCLLFRPDLAASPEPRSFLYGKVRCDSAGGCLG